MNQRFALPDRELVKAAEGFLNKAVPRTGPSPADLHAMVQQFGQYGSTLQVGARAMLIISKRCQLTEWTLDSTLVGTAGISLQWASWATPRVWTDMVGSGTGPQIVGQSNAGSAQLADWTGPLLLRKHDAILMTVTASDFIEQLTLALYMKELNNPAGTPTVAH
jgi:hypothetical protein